MIDGFINFLKYLWETIKTAYEMWGYLFHFGGNITSAFSWLPTTFVSLITICIGWAIVMKVIGRDG